MTDLILINPGGREEIYQDLGNELTAIEPPLWCRLIAGYVRDQGFEVEIIDAEAENLTYEEVAYRVKDINPKLVGMVVYGHQPSASTQQMAPAGKTCKAIKGVCNTPIVICGGHVTVLPERTLKEEAVDYVATGEGVLTIIGLLDNIPKMLIPGLVWEGGRNPPPPNMDVKDLHGNVWDLLPMEKYRAHNWQGDRQPYASIYTSLGCPYACGFCCINAPFGGKGYRTRRPEDVVSEILQLNERYGVKTFKIIDEMFVLKPTHYIPICEALKDLELDLNIWAYARVDTVKPETLSLLRSAGIQWLALGIESGAEIVRDGSDKSLNQNDIITIVKTIQDHDIKVIGNFIFGLPEDTIETMQQTLDLALKLDCEFANFYSAMAYPGSHLFKITPEEDLPKEWSGYSQHSYNSTPLPTETLTSAEVLRFRDDAHCQYFTGKLAIPLKRALYER